MYLDIFRYRQNIETTESNSVFYNMNSAWASVIIFHYYYYITFPERLFSDRQSFVYIHGRETFNSDRLQNDRLISSGALSLNR